jgi:adenylate cyclase class IV
MTKDGPLVLFTAKPSKIKTEKGTEENQEFEFVAPDGEWDRILTFCSGMGLQVCRLKWKKGSGYMISCDGFPIHAELLDVKYLGWFLEMEICPESLEGFDMQAADRALRKVLSQMGIDESQVEGRGYNRMLRLIGREKG